MSNLSYVRIGNITSSEVVALTTNGKEKNSFGVSFYTYVEECRMERFFKHKLENEIEVKAFSWGKLCEPIVHELLPTEYIMLTDETFQNHEIKESYGTPDGAKDLVYLEQHQNYSIGTAETVTETKCPLTRKAFYNLVKRLYDFDGVFVTKKENIDGNEIIQLIRKDSKEGEKYYWQIIDNASNLKAKFGELIVFMPYFEELELIKDYNRTLDDPFWLVERAKDGELPFIYKESGIANINIIRFEIPEEDRLFLESRKIKAIELINQ